MGWDNNHDILTAPIELADIALAAGQSAPPYDLGTMIISGTDFNMWSKNKPCRVSNPGIITPTERRQAKFGMNIPRFALGDFKTHFTDTWGWNRPRGVVDNGVTRNEWFRSLDFDGYLHNNYWLTGADSTSIYSIFNSYLGVSSATVSAGDTILFDIRCCDDPDSGLPGLLYPYDFNTQLYSGIGDDGYDLSLYYMGIGILDSNNVLRVKTGDRMNAHHTLNDVDASMVEAIPNSCADGTLKIIPLLASQESRDPVSQELIWESNMNGYLISLNGAHITVTKRPASSNINVDVTVTVYPSYVRLAFTVQNTSSTIDYTISKMWAYLLSAGAYYNEYETSKGYDGPYVDPSTDVYIGQSWPDTPELSYQNHSTYDILLSDRDGGSYFPDLVSAYGLNAFGGTTSGFYHANGDSSVLVHGTTVTWYQDIHQTEDGYDDYTNFAVAYLCIKISPNIPFVEGPFFSAGI